MTAAPPRARGLIDPASGRMLALAGGSAVLLDADRATDITPSHPVECAAIGLRTVAMAGGGRLTWTDGLIAREVVAPEIYRLAVRGTSAAAVTEDGEILVWLQFGMGGFAGPLRGRFAGAADGVLLAGLRQLAVWGWTESGPASLSMLEMRSGQLVARPGSRGLEPVAGVAFPIDARWTVIGTADEVVVVDRRDTIVARHGTPGLERVAVDMWTLVWVRSTGRRATPLVGVGRLADGAVRDVVERPMPGSDPFPALAAAGDTAVLLSGTAQDSLTVYRLGQHGWAPPRKLHVPRSAPSSGS